MSQRKFSYIPLALIVIVGAVWAGSMITPDKPGFPSLPNTAGTIGNILEPGKYFTIDGTATGGLALGGTGANGYLKGVDCAASDASWKGIDASGNPICKGPPLAFAEIYEGSMQVNGVVQPIGTLLREGDRIQTNATQTGTIKFYNNPGGTPISMGDSIARLGTGTSVYIDRGDVLGTLALVSLEDGLLWGRVLSSTGIDFGGGGVIAGVRGTSIALEKVAGQPLVRMVIPHSQRTGNTLSNAAARIRTIYTNDVYSPLQFRRSIEFNTGSVTGIGGISSTNRTLQQLYTTWQPARLSPWIATNTVRDLTYMIGLNRAVGSYVNNEIISTEPLKGSIDDPCKVNNTLWYDRTTKCAFMYADASTNYDLTGSSLKWEALAVRDITNTEGAYDASGRHPSFRDGNWLGFNNRNSEAGNPFNNSASGAYKYSNLFGGILAVGGPANTSHYSSWYGGSCNPLSGITETYCQLVLSHHESSHSSPRDLYQSVWLRTNQPYLFYQNQTQDGDGALDWNNSGYYSMVRFISGYQRNDLVGGTTYNINTGTLNIDRAGEYLTYAGTAPQLESYLVSGNLTSSFTTGLQSLAGKTITIELANAPTINASSKYLLDLGGVNYYMVNSELRRRIGATPPTTERVISTSDRVFEVTIPTGVIIDRFIIGNNSTNYATPINNQIQKIIIK